MSLNPTITILIGLYISQRVSGVDEINNSTSTLAPTLTPSYEPTFAPSFSNSTEERIEKVSGPEEPSGLDGYMIFLFAFIFIILIAFYYFIRNYASFQQGRGVGYTQLSTSDRNDFYNDDIEERSVDRNCELPSTGGNGGNSRSSLEMTNRDI